MTVRQRFVRNVLSNYAGYGISILVSLFLSPFIVRTLGDSMYGVWVLLISLTGYYGLLDLGVRGAVTQYVARYKAKGDEDGVNRTLNTSLAFLGACSGIVLLAAGLVVVYLPAMIDVPAERVANARWAAGVLGVLFALTPLMAVWGAMMIACERFDLSNGVGIFVQLLRASATVAALLMGYGVVGLAVVQLASQALGWLLRYRISRRLVPEFRFAASCVSRASLRELFGFGVFAFIARLCTQIVDFADVILIAIVFRDPVAVTFFTIGQMLIPHFHKFLGAATMTIAPFAAARDATGETGVLRSVTTTGTRWTFLLSTVIFGGLAFTGSDFLGLWMGEKYLAGEPYASSGHILLALGLAMHARMFQYAGQQVLMGMRQVRFLAFLGAAEAIANVVLSLLFLAYMPELGLLGIAFGTLVPALVRNLVIEPRYLLHKLDLRWGAHLKAALPGSLVAFLAMWGVDRLLRDVFVIEGWLDFLLKCTLLAAPAAVLGIIAALSSSSVRAAPALLRRILPRRP